MIKNLDEFQSYQAALELSDEIWKIVIHWEYFNKDTIGKQLIKAVDSIAANLAEGLGRFHYKETKQFAYYSRGSLFETKTWLQKAHSRRLITDDELERFSIKLDKLGVKINNYINSIGNKNG